MPYKKGFTLIELLIGIAILAILSATVITATAGQGKKARDAQRKNDLQAFKKGMESVKNDCRNAAFYPRASASTVEGTRFAQVAAYLANPNLKYLPSTLQDPSYDGSIKYYRLAWTAAQGVHCPNASGTPFGIQGTINWVARGLLENGSNDPDRLKSYNQCLDKITLILPLTQGAGGFEPSSNLPSQNDSYYYVCSE